MSVTDLKALMKVVVNYRGERPSLLRESFFRASKRFTPVLATEADGIRFYVSTTDDGVGRECFVHGGYDRAAMTHVVKTLATHGDMTEPLRIGR